MQCRVTYSHIEPGKAVRQKDNKLKYKKSKTKRQKVYTTKSKTVIKSGWQKDEEKNETKRREKCIPRPYSGKNK